MDKKQNWFEKLSTIIKENRIKFLFAIMTSFTTIYKFIRALIDIKNEITMSNLLHNSDFIWGLFMLFVTIAICIYWYISSLQKRLTQFENEISYLFVKSRYFDIFYNKHKNSQSGSPFLVNNDDFRNLFTIEEMELVKAYESELNEIMIRQRGVKNTFIPYI
jgi:hypothetical protein